MRSHALRARQQPSAAAPTWTYVGNNGSGTWTNSLTLALPTGTQAGDLLVACISFGDNDPFPSPTGDINWTAPTDWVIHAQEILANTFPEDPEQIGGGLIASIVRGASTPGNVFTRNIGTYGGFAASIGRIHAYRLSSGTPQFVGVSSNTLAVNSTTAQTGSLSPADDGSLIVAACCVPSTASATGFTAATDPTATNDTLAVASTQVASGTWRRVASNSRSGNGGTRGTAIVTAHTVKAAAGATGQIQATSTLSARHAMLAGMWRAQ